MKVLIGWLVTKRAGGYNTLNRYVGQSRSASFSWFQTLNRKFLLDTTD